MTYAFTYTILTHSFVIYKGEQVIDNIMYQVDATRSDGKTARFELSLPFCWDSVDKVIPNTRQKYDASDNLISESEYADRSDFKSYASLSIPNDLQAWVKSHHEDTAVALTGLKNYTDYKIGG